MEDFYETHESDDLQSWEEEQVAQDITIERRESERDTDYDTIREIVAVLTDEYVESTQEQDSERITSAAVAYASAFQALQLYRIANVLEREIAPSLQSPNVHPHMVTALNSIAKALYSHNA